MLSIEHLSCKLGKFHLQDATFTVNKGDYFVLLGESGAGKTIILELLMGLTKPAAGRILLDGRDISSLPIHKRSLGLVYQDRALFPHLSVRRNISYGLTKQNLKLLELLAEQVGAGKLLERMPETLSLGEAQRVALARTLARNPQILMLDEPLASLDVQSRTAIRALLRRLNLAGQTIIHVTHDYHEAFALATRVAVLENGQIAQLGTPDEIFHHPKSRFVAEFVGIKNFFHGVVEMHDGERRFRSPSLEITLPESTPTGYGCVMFSSHDVTLSVEKPHGSARNVLHGRVVDIEPVPGGLEVSVDVGIVICALITRSSLKELTIAAGLSVWLSFKATSVRFISAEEALP